MVTGLYAGILAIIYAVLSFRAVQARVKNKQLFGDGGNIEIIRTIRIHGNFAEYAPFTLLLMALYEMQAASMYLLHAFGIALVVARLLHVWGLHADKIPGRIAGTALTLTLLVILGVLLILKGIILMQVA